MPKRVDQEGRRREIIEAVYRITARGGLAAVSFREVAAEAGVSVNLIQYYFGTMDRLLLASLFRLAGQIAARIERRLARLGPVPSPKDAVRAILSEFLPTTDERREAMLLFVAFNAASFTNPTLKRPEASQVGISLVEALAQQIRVGQRAGTIPDHADAETEAIVLMTMLSGLSSAVLGGIFTAGRASKIIDHVLDRLFGPDGARTIGRLSAPNSRSRGIRRRFGDARSPARDAGRPRSRHV